MRFNFPLYIHLKFETSISFIQKSLKDFFLIVFEKSANEIGLINTWHSFTASSQFL